MIKTGKSFQFSRKGLLSFFLLLQAALWFLSIPVENAIAEEIRVTASVDKRELTLEDSVTLSIRVEGVRQAPQPELPAMEGFRVRSRTSSSSIQIINGRKSSSFTHNVLLIPEKTGSFTIGPASVEIDGKIYRTEPLTLSVHPPSKTLDTTRKVFAELTVSKTRPYVQEQITAILRVYHRVEIRNLSSSLTFAGFREEKLGAPQQYIRVIKGIRYGVYEIHTALFPLRAGTVEIPFGQIELDLVDRSRQRGFLDPFNHGSPFDPFTPLQHKTLRTPPLILEIQPLPEKGRPADFSNLVGEFFLTSALSRNAIEVGDTTTLTVTIAGQGNILDLSLPPLNGGESFKVYEDQPEYRQIPGSQLISGDKIFHFALVPLQAGELQVPQVSLSYFNPIKAEYVSLKSDRLILRANPSSGEKVPEVFKKAPDAREPGANPIKKLAEDILPIHTGSELQEIHNVPAQRIWVYGLGLVFPPGLFFIYRGVHQRRHRLKHDIAFSRSHRAYKQATERLNVLSRDGTKDSVARELSLIVREYLGDILNLHGTAITSIDVDEKLKGERFNPETLEATRRLLEKCEIHQYGSIGEERPDELMHEARRLLDRLEKQL